MDANTRLIDLTWGQLQAAIRREVGKAPLPTSTGAKRWLVYGIPGLAELLGCSEPTAQRIKATGLLDEAIIQYGRIVIIDAEKALSILKNIH